MNQQTQPRFDIPRSALERALVADSEGKGLALHSSVEDT
jgi:hypothetical protein